MLHRQPERLETHLESLDRVTDYLRDLVEELLTLSRFERGMIKLEKTHVTLQTIIERAIDNNLAGIEEKQIKLDVNVPQEDVVALVDSTYVERLLNNLLVNAINYSNADGAIAITLRLKMDDAYNQNAIFTVTDNGQGIDIKLLPDEIFDPFVRPSQGSQRETGMGLAMAREIVLAHSGKITADNRAQGGSIFTVTLPIDS